MCLLCVLHPPIHNHTFTHLDCKYISTVFSLQLMEFKNPLYAPHLHQHVSETQLQSHTHKELWHTRLAYIPSYNIKHNSSRYFFQWQAWGVWSCGLGTTSDGIPPCNHRSVLIHNNPHTDILLFQSFCLHCDNLSNPNIAFLYILFCHSLLCYRNPRTREIVSCSSFVNRYDC